jgi:thioesterase domain-containing protein
MMEADHVASLGAALSAAIAGAAGRRTARPEDGYSPIVTLRFGSPGGAPLFCVPGAGASVASFNDLGSCLDPVRPIYVFQPRGLDEDRLPHATVQAAADCYLRALLDIQPAGPVHLLGHSFGGWVAFELAQRLRRAGRSVGSLTILDSDVPDDDVARVRERTNNEAVLKLIEATEQAAGRPLGIAPDAIEALDETGRLRLLHDGLVRLGLMPRRSDLEVLRGPFRTFATCLRTTYRPDDLDPGPVRLVLVNDPACDDAANEQLFAETIQGWRRWAPHLVFFRAAGNHMTALKSPHVQSLASCLVVEAVG